MLSNWGNKSPDHYITHSRVYDSAKMLGKEDNDIYWIAIKNGMKEI